MSDMDRDWELNGRFTAEPADETLFQCPCGDPECVGHADDPTNIKIGKTFYAADCVMANHHPLVIAGRELDAFNQRNR